MNTYKFRNIDGKILTVETDNITRAVEIAGRYGFFEDNLPDVGKMVQEKREFFLKVCASSYALKSVIPYDTQIEHALEFTNKVFEKLNHLK